MDITQMKYFQTVARTEHLTKAANELHITQPALSVSLARFEKEVGMPLFDRIGRKLRLNKFGQVYLTHVNTILSDLENAQNEIRNLNNETAGSITFGVISLALIQNIVYEFKKEQPHISLRQYEIMPIDISTELIKEDCDFIITSTCDTPDYNANYRILSKEKMYLAVNSSRSIAKKKHIELKDIENETFINLPSGYNFRSITEEMCERSGFEMKVSKECFHCQLLDHVLDDTGVAMVVENVAARAKSRQLLKDSISFVPIDDSYAMRNIVALWRKNKELSKASRLFLDYIENFYNSTD